MTVPPLWLLWGELLSDFKILQSFGEVGGQPGSQVLAHHCQVIATFPRRTSSYQRLYKLGRCQEQSNSQEVKEGKRNMRRRTPPAEETTLRTFCLTNGSDFGFLLDFPSDRNIFSTLVGKYKDDAIAEKREENPKIGKEIFNKKRLLIWLVLHGSGLPLSDVPIFGNGQEGVLTKEIYWEDLWQCLNALSKLSGISGLWSYSPCFPTLWEPPKGWKWGPKVKFGVSVEFRQATPQDVGQRGRATKSSTQ